MCAGEVVMTKGEQEDTCTLQHLLPTYSKLSITKAYRHLKHVLWISVLICSFFVQEATTGFSFSMAFRGYTVWEYLMKP